MHTNTIYYGAVGIVLILFCLFIRYHIAKRRFGRRGIGGLQHFSSYPKAITVRFFERLFLLIANLSGLAGLVLLAAAGLKLI